MTNRISKIFLLDWYKTLSNTKFWVNILKTEPLLFTKIEKYIFGTHPEVARNWMTGKHSSEEVVEKISLEFNLNKKYLLNELIKSSREMEFVSPEIPKVIGKLRRKGHKFYVFTDNMDTFDRWTAPSLKLDKNFDGIINSFYVGALKKELLKNGESAFLQSNAFLAASDKKNMILFDDNDTVAKIYSDLGLETYLVTEENNLFKQLSRWDS